MHCAHEHLLTPIADYVAGKLYKENNAMFMHKHYNELYPVVSLVEDRSKNLYSQLRAPSLRVFFRPAASAFLGIHKVFLRKASLLGEKIPRQSGTLRL